jgi:hypothetical protein
MLTQASGFTQGDDSPDLKRFGSPAIPTSMLENGEIILNKNRIYNVNQKNSMKAYKKL